MALHSKTPTLASLEKDLQKEAIQLVIRRNEAGIIYGMTYIDYKNKVVFNGSDLGKEYSAKGLIERLAQRIVQAHGGPNMQRSTGLNSVTREQTENLNIASEKEKSNVLETTIALLMRPTKIDNYMPYQLRGKKKKRKRKSQNL